jgi:two-component system, OmpR family, response regulator VicR
MRALLIVDDDADTNAALCELLMEEGFTCSSARDGREGLLLLEAERPDLVILDFDLRGMHAIDFLREKASRPSSAVTPVIIVTAYRHVTVLPGAVAVLQKPFEIDDLVQEIRKHLLPTDEPEA